MLCSVTQHAKHNCAARRRMRQPDKGAGGGAQLRRRAHAGQGRAAAAAERQLRGSFCRSVYTQSDQVTKLGVLCGRHLQEA